MNKLNLIVDAAKNDDMERVIQLATEMQDKFCDNNCVWTDHHPDCVRAEPEWYHVIDVHGCNRFYHKTEDCPYESKTPLYTQPQEAAPRKPLTLETIYETIIYWDEGGGKRSRRELARRIVELAAQQRQPLTDEQITDAFFKTETEMDNSFGNFQDGVRYAEAAHDITGEQK
jgi:hypothetical protein